MKSNKHQLLGLIFGAGIGLDFGIVTNNIAVGISLGAGAGIVVGTFFGKYG